MKNISQICVGVALAGVPALAHAQCDPERVVKLFADDGAQRDLFGRSVSISGNTAVVGAYLDDDNGTDSGSAYVFETVDGAWTQVAKLIAKDGAAGDAFGWSVGVFGNTVVVGARGRSDDEENPGSTYVFETIDDTWVQTAQLFPDLDDDNFGVSAAVSEATILIGARGVRRGNGLFSGSAYFFEKRNGQWVRVARVRSDFDEEGNDSFGLAVNISGDKAIVSAPLDNTTEYRAGAAYIFEKVHGTWERKTKIVPDDGERLDWFGSAVDISGDRVIVGARFDDNENVPRNGSAYVFDRMDGVWTQTAKLITLDRGRSDGSQDVSFGVAVGISGTTALIGAVDWGQDGFVTGTGYLFRQFAGVWTEQARILPDNNATGDHFAWALELSGQTAILGAAGDDWGNHEDYDAGSAYIFDLNCPLGTPARLTDFTVLDGELISDGLPEIASSDDSYLETEARVTGEVAQPHLMRVRIVAESEVQDPDTIFLTFESHITDVEGTVWLFMRNWRRGELVQVCQFAVGMNDEVQQVTIPRARRFIRTSDGRIKLQIKKIVFFPFTLGGFHSLIDHVEIAVR